MSERLSSVFVKLAAACAAMSVAGAAHGQVVIYVDDDAAGGGDGRSWDSALSDLQDALWAADLVSEDVEIRIAGGTYLPSQNSEYWRAFDLTPSVTQSGLTLRIDGGFRGLGGGGGGGGSPDDRDLKLFETVLSGDLEGDDLPEFVNYMDNSGSVVRMDSDTWRVATSLDGLTIRGAGGWGSGGGGLVVYLDSRAVLYVSNCIFKENRAIGSGGGAGARGHVEFVNCLFLENMARDGGGLALLASPSWTSVSNCNFVENEAKYGGGIYARSSTAVIRNSVFSENGVSEPVDGLVDVAYSILPEFFPGEGNLVGDPLFVDAVNGDYRLRADSPCIDAGHAGYATLTGALDMLGRSRVVDDPVAVNSGVGDNGYIDMGMLEYQGCEGDLNGDGSMSSLDLLAFLNRLAEGCR